MYCEIMDYVQEFIYFQWILLFFWKYGCFFIIYEFYVLGGIYKYKYGIVVKDIFCFYKSYSLVFIIYWGSL